MLAIAMTLVLAANASERTGAFVERLNANVSAASAASFHDLLASEPHIAGTPGDARTIERLAEYFRGLGLDVEVHRFHPYLCRPLDAKLEMLGELSATGEPLALDLRERELLEDPATAHPELTSGWNAYSGSGEVTGEVVYANYGTAADFARLKELGVDVRGRIVLARYGGNYRGFKARFAEEAGAAGLIMYTDPADAGSARGAVWPEGGWANETFIQRGSLANTSAPGDVLTPGVEATESAPRLDPESVVLPRIPVQPIGYAAAERIMRRMTGRPVEDDSWRGGLPLEYRLEGGPESRLRLRVQQERFIGESANVVATLRGASRPEEFVVVGCHHDAWGFGASDPLAGMIVLLESARVFAELAEAGLRPQRSILFAAWGAEEFGIIGSTEWVEARRDELARNALAYINLDMAAMGDRFQASASPALRGAIIAAAEAALDPFTGEFVATAWRGRGADGEGITDDPRFGDLGGGSDHVAFWCHAGVPSSALGTGGAQGSSYHSNYDTLAWYHRVVGDDYRSAVLVTRALNALLAELADAPMRPDEPERVIEDVLRLLAAVEAGLDASRREHTARVVRRFESLRPLAGEAGRALAAVRRSDGVDEARAHALDEALLALRLAWIEPEGLPDRPWYRNLYAATDSQSGYAPAMLPLLFEAARSGETAVLEEACERYERVAEELEPILRRIVETG